MSIELEQIRNDLNRKAARKAWFKKGFKIAILLEAAGIVITGLVMFFT